MPGRALRLGFFSTMKANQMRTKRTKPLDLAQLLASLREGESINFRTFEDYFGRRFVVDVSVPGCESTSVKLTTAHPVAEVCRALHAARKTARMRSNNQPPFD